jgi:hypothetical protein
LSDLPNNGNYDGKQLVAKNNGAPPISIYRWIASVNAWVNVAMVKETVAYFVKKKNNTANILCFYDQISNSFITTEQQKEITITDIDLILYGVDNLKTITNKADGDIYVVYNTDLRLHCLYQY